MSGAEDGTAHSLTAAAAYMGYARSTLEEWAKRHPDFSADLTRAKGLRLFRLEAELMHAQGSSQVTARMFVLRGESPEEYSETYKIKHAHGVDDVDPITKMLGELKARVLRPVELPPPKPIKVEYRDAPQRAAPAARSPERNHAHHSGEIHRVPIREHEST